MATIINKFGEMTGWNNTTVNLLGRDLEGIEELKYSDEVKKEWVYGAGNKPIGYSTGNYEAKGEISIHKEEVMGLQNALEQGKHIADIAPFDVVVEYANQQGVITKDRLRNCMFTGNGVELKNNEGKTMVKFDLMISHVEWDVI